MHIYTNLVSHKSELCSVQLNNRTTPRGNMECTQVEEVAAAEQEIQGLREMDWEISNLADRIDEFNNCLRCKEKNLTLNPEGSCCPSYYVSPCNQPGKPSCCPPCKQSCCPPPCKPVCPSPVCKPACQPVCQPICCPSPCKPRCPSPPCKPACCPSPCPPKNCCVTPRSSFNCTVTDNYCQLGPKPGFPPSGCHMENNGSMQKVTENRQDLGTLKDSCRKLEQTAREQSKVAEMGEKKLQQARQENSHLKAKMNEMNGRIQQLEQEFRNSAPSPDTGVSVSYAVSACPTPSRLIRRKMSLGPEFDDMPPGNREFMERFAPVGYNCPSKAAFRPPPPQTPPPQPCGPYGGGMQRRDTFPREAPSNRRAMTPSSQQVRFQNVPSQHQYDNGGCNQAPPKKSYTNCNAPTPSRTFAQSPQPQQGCGHVNPVNPNGRPTSATERYKRSLPAHCNMQDY